jgi:S1-C subfamily serine protease
MIFSGLALAIPSNTVGAWASGSTRTTRRPRLGATVQVVALPSYQGSMGQRAGLVVAGVAPDSPADRAGLLVGDVLLAVAGEPVEEDAASLREALARVGEVVRLRVMRGGETREVEVELGASGRPRARGA